MPHCTCRRKCWPGAELSARTFRNHKKYRDYDAVNPGWWIPAGGLEMDLDQAEDGQEHGVDRTLDDIIHGQEPPPVSHHMPIMPLSQPPSQLSLPPSGAGLDSSNSMSDAPTQYPSNQSPLSSPSDSSLVSPSSTPSHSPLHSPSDSLPPLPDDTTYEDLEDLPHPSLEDLRLAMQFIYALRGAKHENSGLSAEVYNQIYTPLKEAFTLDNHDARLSLEVFIHTQNASRESYEAICQAIKQYTATFIPTTWAQMNNKLASWTGVYLLRYDMCPRGCFAYTAHLSELTHCPKCGETRYDPIKLEAGKQVPQQQFYCLPPSTQIQARWSHPARAHLMKHAVQELERNINTLKSQDSLPSFHDVFSSRSLLDAFSNGRISPHDTLLMISCDGAQIYQSKMSDCWFGIGTILNLPPNIRYSRDEVLPTLVIPGPHKPDNLSSFYYPLLHQYAALMKQGVNITDGEDGKQYCSKVHLVLAGADGPGLTTFDGGVGHTGAAGCRLHCPLRGRHKRGVGTYYPVLKLPDDYHVRGCDHSDVEPLDIVEWKASEQTYLLHVAEILRSQNQRQYERARLATGLVRPSLFLGLPPEKIIGVPAIFCLDFMHFPALNAPDLLIPLFRGTLDRDWNDTDPWPWSEHLADDVKWHEHGALVAACAPWIASWYGQAPRNPALKINTDFKAWEFMIYLFTLGPMVFRPYLPEPYWIHFCKLVRIIELSGQTEITQGDLIEIEDLALEWQQEYEDLYVQRKPSRIHFVRPWIHLLLHLANEIVEKGPPAYYSQWTMERVIGYLKEGLRLHSNPYANLAHVATRICQIGALRAMLPDFAKDQHTVYDTGHDLGDHYAALHPWDKYRHTVDEEVALSLSAYMEEQGLEGDHEWNRRKTVLRFARLAVANDSVVHSLWREEQKSSSNAKVNRHCELVYNDKVRYGEVKYFCNLPLATFNKDQQPVAVLTLFGNLDAEYLKNSSNVYRICHKEPNIVIVGVKSIKSVITIIPDEKLGSGFWYVGYKPSASVFRVLGQPVEYNEDV